MGEDGTKGCGMAEHHKSGGGDRPIAREEKIMGRGHHGDGGTKVGHAEHHFVAGERKPHTFKKK